MNPNSRPVARPKFTATVIITEDKKQNTKVRCWLSEKSKSKQCAFPRANYLPDISSAMVRYLQPRITMMHKPCTAATSNLKIDINLMSCSSLEDHHGCRSLKSFFEYVYTCFKPVLTKLFLENEYFTAGKQLNSKCSE